MSVPPKYRAIGDFYEYYSGARTAPYLTVFVGGNHEASNHLFELYYGGWVAPNIYYLGAANVIRLGPLRIAALSGIWKGYNYHRPHHERLPYNQDDVRSIYHVRELDVRKLLQIRTQVDVGISHDWPRAVEWTGDHPTLFRKKNGFETESRAGTLGSPAARHVLARLRPAYWFAAHLHIKFSAVVRHTHDQPQDADAVPVTPSASGTAAPTDNVLDQMTVDRSKTTVRNEDEIDLDLDEVDEPIPITEQANDPGGEPQTKTDFVLSQSIRDQLPASFTRSGESRPLEETNSFPAGITNQVTNFLALDKCLPGRRFLQVLAPEPVSISSDKHRQRNHLGRFRLEYDKEWLAILRVFASHLTLGDRTVAVPAHQGEAFYRPLIEQEEEWIEANVVPDDGLMVPLNFQRTMPPYTPTNGGGGGNSQLPPSAMPEEYNNPQTARFCSLIGIENHFFLSDEQRAERMASGPAPPDHTRPDLAHRGGGRSRWRGRGSESGRGGERGRHHRAGPGRRGRSSRTR